MFGFKFKRRKQDERDLNTLRCSAQGLLKTITQFVDYVNGVIKLSSLNLNIEDIIAMRSFSTMMKSYVDIYVNNKFARPGLMFSIEHTMVQIDTAISSINDAFMRICECVKEHDESTLFDQVFEMGKHLGEIKSYLRMISLSIHGDNVRIDCGVDIIQEYYDNIKDLKKFYQPPSSSKYVIQFTTYNDTFKKKEEDKHEQ